jgi:hypothetical protein
LPLAHAFGRASGYLTRTGGTRIQRTESGIVPEVQLFGKQKSRDGVDREEGKDRRCTGGEILLQPESSYRTIAKTKDFPPLCMKRGENRGGIMRTARYNRLFALVGFVALIAIGTVFHPLEAYAEVVEVMPTTDHSTLTLTTDESYGYQVLPGRPLVLDLVGPGALNVTVRLNHKSKRSVFTGRFEMKRGKRRIKKAKLKLHRSRVGAYKEEASLHPSLPKVFKVRVPKGVHSYTFSLRAPKGTGMTLLIKYDTKADQSKARKEDEELALVPLIPTTPEKSKTEGDEIALVPLVPVGDSGAKKAPTTTEKSGLATARETKPAKDKPEEKPKKIFAVKDVEKPTLPVKPTPVSKTKPEEKKIAASSTGTRVRTIAEHPVTPPVVEKKAPVPSAPVVSLGLKFGQISPLQKVGGTTYTGSLDVRYILPIWDGRLTLGVEAGYYQYKMTIDSERRDISLMVIPIALQMFYRIPINTIIEPYVGLGGDVFICMGEDTHSDTDYTYSSGTKAVFGGHIAAGLEAKLGPGFLLAEVRAGISFGDPGVWQNSPSISGLLAVAGYRFVF